jgi:hypothetical protein
VLRGPATSLWPFGTSGIKTPAFTHHYGHTVPRGPGLVQTETLQSVVEVSVSSVGGGGGGHLPAPASDLWAQVDANPFGSAACWGFLGTQHCRLASLRLCLNDKITSNRTLVHGNRLNTSKT